MPLLLVGLEFYLHHFGLNANAVLKLRLLFELLPAAAVLHPKTFVIFKNSVLIRFYVSRIEWHLKLEYLLRAGKNVGNDTPRRIF